MTIPANEDFEVWIGNDEDYQFELDGETGAPINLTGSTIMFTAFKADGTELLSKQLTITDAINGIVTLSLTKEETRLIPLSSVVSYEIERRIAGKQKTFVYGNIIAAGGKNDD